MWAVLGAKVHTERGMVEKNAKRSYDYMVGSPGTYHSSTDHYQV
jgi:hypothetical protein